MTNLTFRRTIGLALILALAAPLASAQVDVTKTVDDVDVFGRANWTIAKTVDVGSEITLACEEALPIEYQVTVTKTGISTEFDLAGNVTVTNTSGGPITLTDVTDTAFASENPAFNVTFGIPGAYPIVLGSGASVVLPYLETVTNPGPPNLDRNRADATTSAGAFSSPVVEFNPNFGETVSRDRCVSVTDPEDPSSPRIFCFDVQPTNPPGAIVVGGASHTFTYPGVLGPFSESGPHVVTNTATLEGLNVDGGGGGTTGSVSATASFDITVNVECTPGGGGCSRTIGYWKTHSSYGPAGPADPTWEDLPDGPDTEFLNSGVSWYNLFWTPPAGGNGYIKLAHQWMGATLNVMSGASPSVLGTALADAEALMTANSGCRTNWRTCPAGVKSQFAVWHELFDEYNNGDLPGGPEHCDDFGGGGGAFAGTGITEFALAAPAPNPTTGRASVRFELPETSEVRIVAYDVMGREVARLADDTFESGSYQVVFEGASLPAGTYIIRMVAGEFNAVTRVVVTR